MKHDLGLSWNFWWYCRKEEIWVNLLHSPFWSIRFLYGYQRQYESTVEFFRFYWQVNFVVFLTRLGCMLLMDYFLFFLWVICFTKGVELRVFHFCFHYHHDTIHLSSHVHKLYFLITKFRWGQRLIGKVCGSKWTSVLEEQSEDCGSGNMEYFKKLLCWGFKWEIVSDKSVFQKVLVLWPYKVTTGTFFFTLERRLVLLPNYF